jgi:2-keto-4-pentenoate hydratase
MPTDRQITTDPVVPQVRVGGMDPASAETHTSAVPSQPLAAAAWTARQITAMSSSVLTYGGIV